MDRSVIEARLAVLESEFSSGQRLLAEREAQVGALREQLLRISGAARVLAELLGRVDDVDEPARRTTAHDAAGRDAPACQATGRTAD